MKKGFPEFPRGGVVAVAFVLVALAAPARGAPKPACAVVLSPAVPNEVHVNVAGRDVLLERTESAAVEARMFPAGAGAVLVSWAGRDEHGPLGSSSLWKVACKAGGAEVVAHHEGADFGHAALSPDAKSLFFSGPDGIYALDLARKTERRLTQASSGYCAENHVEARDVVGRFVDRRSLSFERGCGYEHAWNADRMVLRDPGTPRMTVGRAPRPPFGGIAADAGGGLWLVDGLCDDASTFSRVLFSADRGDHWQKIPVKMLFDQPVRQVIADREKPGAVLVWSWGCTSDAHQDTGWVYVTTDGGKSFRRVTVPPGIPSSGGEPAAEQDPIAAVEAIEGSIAHLVLYGRRAPGGPMLRWESIDAGKTWSAPVVAGSVPQVRMTIATVGETKFEIRADGLYRMTSGKPASRVYPRD